MGLFDIFKNFFGSNEADSKNVKSNVTKFQESRDEQGWTTLMHACNNGNVDEVLSLIKRGADINAVDNFGYTALIRLASLGGSVSSRFSEGHFEAMKILVDSNAKLNEQDNDGFTALNWAAEKGHANAVKLLLNAGADPEIRGNDGATPYDVATTPEVRALFRTLNDNTPPEEQLLIAAENGDKDTVKELLSQGVDPNYTLSTGFTALFTAVNKKHHELMQLLLDNGADPDIATDGDRRTPLILAAKIGDPKSVELLLNAQADVNKTDAYGGSALTSAAAARFCSKEDKESVLTLLLDAGINTNIETSFGYTAMEVAEQNDCQSAADFIRNYMEEQSKTALVDVDFDEIVENINDSDIEIRFEACQQLGLMGDLRAVDPLINNLTGYDVPYVKKAAVEALGRLGDCRAIKALCDVLDEHEQFLITAVANVLADFGKEEAVPALINASKSHYFMDRADLKALGKIGGDLATSYLFDLLKDDSDYYRSVAAEEALLIWAENAQEESEIKKRKNLINKNCPKRD